MVSKRYSSDLAQPSAIVMIMLVNLSENVAPAAMKQADVVLSASERDVLCGKDKTFTKHFGNRTFKNLIEEYSDRYLEAATKNDRMEITKDIVNIMRTKYHARFLKPTHDGFWEEISETHARDKISHALRFSAKNKGGCFTPNSSTTSTADLRNSVVSQDDSCSCNSTKSTVDIIQEEIIDCQQLHANSTWVQHQQQHQQRRLSGELWKFELAMLMHPQQQRRSSAMSLEECAFDTLGSQDIRALMEEAVPDDEWRMVESMVTQ
jgi:hypothetical protein